MLFKNFLRSQDPQESGPPDPEERLTFMVKRDVKEFLESGKVYFDEGKIDDAIDCYKKAVEADPSCALCHFNLGYAYHENGQHEIARERYEKAIELEPTCSLFLEHIARLQFETLDYQESARLFQRASLVGPIQPVSLGLWGRALFEQGQYQHSIEAFERLLQQHQRSEIQTGARYWLAAANTKLGRMAAARRLAEEILAYNKIDAKILNDLGENFIESRCLSLARRIFERLAMEKEELLMARLRLEDIRGIENQIEDMLPKLFEGDEERTLHQIHALREFGNDRISKALLSLIHTDSAPIRENIIRYQSAYGYDVAPAIQPLLGDPVAYVRDAAYDNLEKLDDGRYVGEMLQGLNDPLLSIRGKAARFVGRFGSMENLPQLEIAVTDPKNREIKQEIREAIQSIKKRYQRKMDSLSRMSTQLTTQELPNTKDWRFWMLLLLQFVFIGYFIYVILFKF